MIEINYTIPIYRELATTSLEYIRNQNDPIDGDIYISNYNVDHNFEFYLEGTPLSEIYEIHKSKKNIKILSNTVNIKITNKYYSSPRGRKIPLYNSVKNIDKLLYNSLIEDLKTELKGEVVVEEYLSYYDIYFNETLNSKRILKEYNYRSVSVIYINRANPDLKIKKIKDRLELTLSIMDPVDTYTIELGSFYLFEPKIHNKNWIEFYECLYRDKNKKLIYMYEHSFNTVLKKELCTKLSSGYIEVKDPYKEGEVIVESILDPINNLSEVTYNSYRSNLLINVNYPFEVFVYINNNVLPSQKTKNIKLFSEISTNTDYLLVLSNKKDSIISDYVLNPYSENRISDSNSEIFTLVDTVVKDKKYNQTDNIRFGNTRILYTQRDIIEGTEIYVIKGDGTVILQERDLTDYLSNELLSVPIEASIDVLANIPSNLITNMNALKSSISLVYPKILNVNTDNTYYYKEMV